MNTLYVVNVESKPKAGDEIVRAVLRILCDSNCKSVPGIPITGVDGDGYSFSISDDGRGDYGPEWEDPSDRFFQTNLRAKTIATTEYFAVGYPEPDTPFQITGLRPFAGQP